MSSRSMYSMKCSRPAPGKPGPDRSHGSSAPPGRGACGGDSLFEQRAEKQPRRETEAVGAAPQDAARVVPRFTPPCRVEVLLRLDRMAADRKLKSLQPELTALRDEVRAQVSKPLEEAANQRFLVSREVFREELR